MIGTYRSHAVHQGRSRRDAPPPLQRALTEAKRYGAHAVSLDFPKAAIIDRKSEERRPVRRTLGFVIRYLRQVLPRRFATQRPGCVLVDKLAEYSGGNAFLLVELVKSLREKKKIILNPGECYKVWELADKSKTEIELPESVKALFDERIGELSDDLRKTLMFASADGLHFSLELLSHLMDTSDQVVLDRLEELVNVHKMIEEGGERTVHDAR